MYAMVPAVQLPRLPTRGILVLMNARVDLVL